MIGAKRLAWGFLHTVNRVGKSNVGILKEWCDGVEVPGEDVTGIVQLFLYQRDDMASRWQRMAFRLGEPNGSIFREDATPNETATVEAYAQYRFVNEQFAVCVSTVARLMSHIYQEAEANTSRCCFAHTHISSVLRRPE